MAKSSELKPLLKQLSDLDYKITNGRKQLCICPSDDIEHLNRNICQWEVQRQTIQYKLQMIADRKPMLGYSNESNVHLNMAPPTYKSHKQ